MGSLHHEKRPVLLIDEIDKADIEFPNDLLLELDRMEFFVYETGESIKAKLRPIVMITSNNEKELPDAFLRRCFFHYIKFRRRRHDEPDRRCALPRHQETPGGRSVADFLRGARSARAEEEALDLRTAGLAQLLLNEDITPEMLRERDPRKLIPPLHGALLKNEQDVHLFRTAGVP